MQDTLDALMEKASAALVRMNYATCEPMCLAALAKAKREKDWDSYGRILNPLQEARRFRRQNMADAAEKYLKSGAAAFLECSEKLGDAVLAECREPLGTVARVKELEEKLNILPDHEKLQQALAEAAKAVLHK